MHFKYRRMSISCFNADAASFFFSRGVIGEFRILTVGLDLA